MADDSGQSAVDIAASAHQSLARVANSVSLSQDLARDLERIRTAFRPIDLSFHKSILDAMEPVRRFQEEISHVFRSQHAITSQIRDLASVNLRLADAVRSVQNESTWLKDAATLHSSWAKRVAEMNHEMRSLRGMAELSVAESCRKLLVSDRIVAQLATTSLRDVLRTNEAIKDFQSLSSKLTADYRSLIDSAPTLPDIIKLPDWALPASSRELFVANYSFRAALVEEEDLDEDAKGLVGEIDAELSDCTALLARVNPALVGLLSGAKAALTNQSPDAARHVLASLRELWTHVLHSLAPDDRVVAWIPKSDPDMLSRGRPTRKARLLYISREIHQDPLSRFVASDSQAALELINVFQRVHEVSPSLTNEQLKALILRTESWIMYVLQLND